MQIKLSLRTCIAGVLASSVFFATPSFAQAQLSLDLPSQPLEQALRSLGQQTKTNILFDPASVRSLSAPAIDDVASVADALTKILAGSGLTYRFIDARTVTLIPANSASSDASRAADDGTAMRGAEAERTLRLAQADRTTQAAQAGNQRTTAAPAQSGDNMTRLEEIVVTAQKRSERLQDVPVPVTAIGAEGLAANSQLRVQDYYSKIPGLSLVLSGNGSTPTVAIRGVTTGGDSNPTVGIVVDEVPYGASANTGQATPDIVDVDPGDLARVEVLRGPQGTLYGAASMGGLIKFVTVDPSTDEVSGRVQVGSTSVNDSDDYGYVVRGAVNVPVSDTFAVRASGFTLRDPGYVDNAETGARDVNRTDSEGGRVSALWRPSDAVALKLNALVQQTERLGTADVDTTLGDDPQQRFLPQSGVYNREIEAYSATLTAKWGGVDFVSASGYSVDTTDDSVDLTRAFGGFFVPLAQQFYGVDREVTVQHRTIKKLTQELRASFPLGDQLDWLVGAFYTNEDTYRTNDNRAADATGRTVGSIFGSVYEPAEFEEYAAFTTLTYAFTERFDVQLGGRYSKNQQEYTRLLGGPFYGGQLPPQPLSSRDSAFTYLLTPRFKLSDDLMIYARFASGYRPGGPNFGCGIEPGLPCEFGADTTQNYDVGIKGSAFDGAVSFDAAVYYIDWKDIQISNIVLGTSTYTDNASRARSQGVELSFEARPSDGLTVSAWAAYNDAQLTEPLPLNSLVGRAGDRLPYSSHFSGSLSLDQDIRIGSLGAVFIGGSVSYVGDRKGNFQATPVRQTFPAYAQIDFRSGLRLDTWTLNLFVNNVADKRGVLRGGLDAVVFPSYFTYIQPRTVGVSLIKEF